MSSVRSLFALPFAAALAFAAPQEQRAADFTRFVDPFIGTGLHGHTYPGATQPFGLVQASPDTRLLGWEACGGYHYTDNFIYGFSHTHLSGVGIPDYGDILVAPESGTPTIATPQPTKGERGYGSHFSHADEQAEPGYYRVKLTDQNVNAELTTTTRVALHRYTFPEKGERSLVLDLEHHDLVLDSSIQVVSPTEIVGYRRSAAWAKDQLIYFLIRFERPVRSVQLYQDSQPVEGASRTGKKLKALISLAGDPGPVQFKVGLSPVNTIGARRNVDMEQPGWDFDATRAAAKAQWNRVLSKIAVDGRDEAQLRTFYTALYHAYVCPNRFDDVDGSYRGRDGEIHNSEAAYYTVFSLWDTYRAWHPLMTILEPEATQNFIRTFLRMYEQGGLLPVWDLAGNETFCMNGYHSVSVIADAYAKGINGFDTRIALEAMVHSATREHFGLGAYTRDGFIAREEAREGVSRTLEYAYDDWCIAQFAGATGHPEERLTFLRRSQNYRNLFSPKDRFFVGRENGGWYAPFNPREINFNYTEGNAWQYRFAVLHDIPGLIQLMGGREKFGQALDALFADKAETEGRAQADVTGLIGQYAQGNEPSHHMAYLYDYVGRPSETQRLVRELLTTMYSDKPEGLSGNEDCGQMSAWYLLSALGFYQVTPGLPRYAIGSPLFDRASIEVDGNKRFVVTALNQSPKNVYIQSATLNGAPLERCYLTHSEIVHGGELVVTLGEKPNLDWGAKPEASPGVAVPDVGFVTTPVVTVPISFRTEAKVTIEPGAESDEIWYTLDGTVPVPGRSSRYTAPFVLTNSTNIACIGARGGNRSTVVRAETHQADTGLRVTINNPISPQYLAGGTGALVDGILGGFDFTSGRWQGYEGCPLDAVVDIGHAAHVKSVCVGFLQDSNCYIFYPPKVTFSVSTDGVNFRELETVEPPATPRDTTKSSVVRVTTQIPAEARYVRVYAPNPGLTLAWGTADEMIKSFLFCDEIQIDHR
ncbi:glycosyl hydrolase family 92 [Opitutaceae bacterium EW11]|nr:glycosyl hydrolase family 92 [Opitutaceae bacterium EW11]